MLKNIVKNLTDITLVIILLVSFVLVGTPIKENTIELSMTIIIIGGIFGVSKLIKKEAVIKDKIDILMLFMYMTPVIPILFETYNDLGDSLIAIVKNLSLFNIYALVRSIICKDEENDTLINNILLFGLLLLTILGFDEMLSKIIFRYMRYIGIPNVVNYEQRIFSTLGYANTFAILMTTGMFLALKRINNGKLQFSSLMYIFTLALLLTYSRSVWALFILILAIYLIFSKTRIYELAIIVINIICALLGVKLFNLFSDGEYVILAWLSIIALSGLSWVIVSCLEKIKGKFEKVKLKTCIVTTIGIMTLAIVIFIIGIRLDTPLHLFSKGQKSEEFRYKWYKIKGETEYTLDLDITSKTLDDVDGIYTIEIAEENKYYDTITTHKISLSEFSGKKTVNFKTNKDTVALVIFCKSNAEALQDGLTINELKINGEKQGLNYLYLPIALVEKLHSFTPENKSVWERLVYFKDAVKIIKIHPLVGNGGNGWRYNYSDVQDYVYAASECHNHMLDVIIDNGVIAGISLVIIYVYLLHVIIKKHKITEIDAAFILLNIHSMMDVNMSFYIVSVIWAVMIALMTKENLNVNISNTKVININKMIFWSYIILNVLVLVLGLATYKLSEDAAAVLKQSKQYIKEEKHNEALNNIMVLKETKKYKGYIYDIIQSVDYSKLDNLSLELIYNVLISEKIKVSAGYNLMINRMLHQALMGMTDSSVSQKIANRIVDTNDIVIKSITNKESNRLKDDIIQMMLLEQETIYINAKNKLLEN